MMSQAFLCALTCLRVIGTPPIPCGVPSIRPSIWDCPMCLITIRWSAPCHAPILILLISSSNLPEAISVVMTGIGCGSASSKYLAGGRPTLFFRGFEQSWYSNGPSLQPGSGSLQCQPLLLGSYLSRSFRISFMFNFSFGANLKSDILLPPYLKLATTSSQYSPATSFSAASFAERSCAFITL